MFREFRKRKIASGWERIREHFMKKVAFQLSLAGKVGLDSATFLRMMNQKLYAVISLTHKVIVKFHITKFNH